MAVSKKVQIRISSAYAEHWLKDVRKRHESHARGFMLDIACPEKQVHALLKSLEGVHFNSPTAAMAPG